MGVKAGTAGQIKLLANADIDRCWVSLAQDWAKWMIGQATLECIILGYWSEKYIYIIYKDTLDMATVVMPSHSLRENQSDLVYKWFL